MDVGLVGLFSLVTAYLLGSVPTAVLVSRAVAGADVRALGDGNMGARNVAHTVGWWPAAVVAVTDAAKGTLGVVFCAQLSLPLEWQLGAGAFAVLGHDFPVFGGFRGGQGLATTIGVLFALLPSETLFAVVLFGTVYLLTRRFNLSAGLGMAPMPFLAGASGHPPIFLAYIAALFLSVPAKTALDLPHRRRVRGDALARR